MTQYSLRNKKYLIISIAVIIFIWQVVAIIFNNRLLLPSFFDVLKEMHRIILKDKFLLLIFNSMFRCIKSFIVSIIVSVTLGISSYFSKLIYNFLYPITVFLKAIPTMAFIVLLLIWTSKDFAPTIIGIVISFPIFYEATLNSLLNIDEGLLHMVTIYRVSRIDKLRVIIIPVIWIQIKKILTSTISLIFKVVISGEVYSQPQYGIGSNIQFEKIQLNTAGVIAWMIIIAFIVYIFDFMMDKSFNRGGNNDNKKYKF